MYECIFINHSIKTNKFEFEFNQSTDFTIGCQRKKICRIFTQQLYNQHWSTEQLPSE